MGTAGGAGVGDKRHLVLSEVCSEASDVAAMAIREPFPGTSPPYQTPATLTAAVLQISTLFY